MKEGPGRQRDLRELYNLDLALGLVRANSAEIEHYYGKEQPNVLYFKRGKDDMASLERSRIPVVNDMLLKVAQEKAQIAMDQARELVERRDRREQFPHAAE
jgi:hypothetical protein